MVTFFDVSVYAFALLCCAGLTSSLLGLTAIEIFTLEAAVRAMFQALVQSDTTRLLETPPDFLVECERLCLKIARSDNVYMCIGLRPERRALHQGRLFQSRPRHDQSDPGGKGTT